MHNSQKLHVHVYVLSEIFLHPPVDYTLAVYHILTSGKPGAAVGTICVLKMPGEPFLIKRDETSVVCTVEPGEMLHGCKY